MDRLTIRTRLTVVYGGLLFAAGCVLLAVTFALTSQNMPKVAPLENSPGPALPGGPVSAAEQENIIGYANELRESTLQSLLTYGAIALLLVTAAATALGWFLAGRALQPLHQITAAARRIASADGAGRGLHERLDLTGPQDEVRELGSTFDLMLERLDRSFDGQRRFVASASHELRTPLAINRSLIELAVTRPYAAPDIRRLGEDLLQVNERHERLIEGLLTLADSENEISQWFLVDLADVVSHVVEQTPSSVDMHVSVEPAPTAGDPFLLERLTQNLVENAIRYNTPHGWVTIRTETDGAVARLVVANTGPVVPAYESEAIFEPFHRLRTERTGLGRGFGLGLSIVRALARAHRGHVTAIPRSDGGLTMIVELPRHPVDARARHALPAHP